MIIIHGDVDDLSNPADVRWLLTEQESGLKESLVLYKKMYHLGHGSFMLAKDMSFMHDVLKVMKENGVSAEQALEVTQ